MTESVRNAATAIFNPSDPFSEVMERFLEGSQVQLVALFAKVSLEINRFEARRGSAGLPRTRPQDTL
jgi:hypothetical protein